VKTGVRIWAFENLATRFNAAGYTSEPTRKSIADKVRTTVAGLGDSAASLGNVHEALDGQGIYCVASGLHLDPRFGKGAFCSPSTEDPVGA